jgi:hypothetical protein
MPENTTVQSPKIVQKGHQPLPTMAKDGYQPTSPLKGGPPQGGSGVPNAAPSKSKSSSGRSAS